jgi:hypothetical protein
MEYIKWFFVWQVWYSRVAGPHPTTLLLPAACVRCLSAAISPARHGSAAIMQLPRANRMRDVVVCAQPLPTPLARPLFFLPLTFHHAAFLGMFASEVGLPAPLRALAESCTRSSLACHRTNLTDVCSLWQMIVPFFNFMAAPFPFVAAVSGVALQIVRLSRHSLVHQRPLPSSPDRHTC